MRGSCSPESMSTTRVPPTAGFHNHHPGVVGDDLADDGGFGAQRVFAHGGENPSGGVGGNQGDQLSFVGDVEGVEPEDFARAAHLLGDRNPRLLEPDSRFRPLGDLWRTTVL